MNELIIANAGSIVKRLRELINTQATDDFNKRDTGLELKTFLTVFAVHLAQMGKVTLEELADKCESLQPGLTMTRQAMRERMKAGAKELKNSWRRSPQPRWTTNPRTR